MEEQLKLGKEIFAISPLVDPFKKNGFSRACIFIHPPSQYRNHWKYEGEIDFRISKTSGTQEFEAENLDALLKQMQDFMNDLENK